jgi:hypothetical protein
MIMNTDNGMIKLRSIHFFSNPSAVALVFKKLPHKTMKT